MTKKLVALLLVVCLTVWITGCGVTTTGSASWEMYGGFRTINDGEIPAKVEFESSVVDKILRTLTDDEVTEDE